MKKFGLNIPINSVSFGQLSFAILKEILDRGIEPNLFSIGQIDFNSQKASQEELAYLYDVLGATDVVEKIEKTKDGSKKSKKQSKDIDKEQE